MYLKGNTNILDLGFGTMNKGNSAKKQGNYHQQNAFLIKNKKNR